MRRCGVRLLLASLAGVVAAISAGAPPPAGRAETTASVAIGCEFLADAIDGTLADVTSPADLTDACDSIDAADVTALATTLGDHDSLLEVADFAAVDLDANQIIDSTYFPGAGGWEDSIYVFAFVDDDESVTFDASAGVAVAVNADGVVAPGVSDANTETCGTGEGLDRDCDTSTIDDGDGVVIATITDSYASPGNSVLVDTSQADNASAIESQLLSVRGTPDEVWIDVAEDIIDLSTDAATCTEGADSALATAQWADPDRTLVRATVTDSHGYDIARIPVQFLVEAPVLADETEASETASEPSFDSGVSIGTDAFGIAALAIVCAGDVPGTGSVTAVILAGQPGEETATATILVSGAVPNDIIDLATELVTVPAARVADTTGATLEIGEPQPCGSIGATIWYLLIVPSDVVSLALNVDTIGSGFDTVLAAYEGSHPMSPPGGVTYIACDDNGAGAQSQLTFTGIGGHRYYIQAGGASGATGSLTLHINCVADVDCDGVDGQSDNCSVTRNPGQANTDAGNTAIGFAGADTVGDACDTDDDGDGCADAEETAAYTGGENFGGWRDPLSVWDFYDVNGDARIDLNDTLDILAHFGHGTADDPLDNRMDRMVPGGAQPWQTAEDTSGNGIDLTDALDNLASFGHDCSAPPD